MVPSWPPLVINLKQHILGKKVQEYVEKAEKIASQYQQPLIICPSFLDLSSTLSLPRKFVSIFAQSYHLARPGQSLTGAVCPSSLAELGVAGSLLNHYEKRIYGEKPGKECQLKNQAKDFQKLIELIKLGKEAGLKLIVCADQAATAQKIAREITHLNLNEISLAVEWDEYIGTNLSMVRHQPEEINKTVQMIKEINENIPVYCGAGVQGADIKKAIQGFGVQGALVATYCTKAPEFQGDYESSLHSIFQTL